MLKARYTNSTGKVVEVRTTRHAVERFRERWERFYPSSPIDDARSLLIKMFNQSTRMRAKDRKHQARRKRHGDDTLYFHNPPFTFVVQDCALVTVEIGGDAEQRQLNKAGAVRREPRLNAGLSNLAVNGVYLAPDGVKREVNLGRYDPPAGMGSIDDLQGAPDFREAIFRKFREKGTQGQLLLALVRESKRSKPVAIELAGAGHADNDNSF